MTKHEEMAIAAIGALIKAGELRPEDVNADNIRRGIERLKRGAPRFASEECEAFAVACRALASNPEMGRHVYEDGTVSEAIKDEREWTYMAERASGECPPYRFGSDIRLMVYHDALSAEGFTEAAAEAWSIGLHLGIVRGEAPEYFTPEEYGEQLREQFAAERRALEGKHGVCVYCKKASEGEHTIHRDRTLTGDELPLCNACGGAESPTCDEIWAKIADENPSS